MSIPKPPIELKDHCSTVFDNTLYVYSPAGFQSLPLTQGAEWKTLSPGVSVTGGVCAPSTANGDNSLYIVGGAANSTSASYPGLQKYSFASKSWETVTPVVSVTQNRQNHGAAYINSLSSILVYAGSQDGDTIPSSQTFLIQTVPPFGVLSFSQQAAPPLFAPMLMQWDDQHALMIGGSTQNKQVFTFGQPEGWVDLGTTLADPITDQSTVKCSLITGDDGSKVLEIFNLGTTPNTVSRVALWADGKPAPVGQYVGVPSSTKRRRDLTVNNWPAYNDTLAPTVKRTGYSLATSAEGLVVMTGGDSSDPLAMFDQRNNTWVNATSLLVEKNQIPLSSPSSTSLPSVSVVTPTAIASASASPTNTNEVAPTSNHPKGRVTTILGAVLGVIFALAILLIIILLLLRRKQKKKQKSEKIDEKDGRLSFADQGAEFMHEAGGSRGRAYSASLNSSVASLQVFNKGAKTKTTKVPGHRRGMASDSSQLGLVKAKSPLGINEPLEMSQMEEKSTPLYNSSKKLSPAPSTRKPPPTYASSNQLRPNVKNSPPRKPATPIAAATAAGAAGGAALGAAVAGATPDDASDRDRSNGWSRYFANNEVTNLASMQSGRSTYGTNADTYRTSDASRSEYDDRNMSSTSVPRPLELNLGPKFDGQRLSRVATGSPTMGRSTDEIREGQTAQISRAGSTSSEGSDSTLR